MNYSQRLLQAEHDGKIRTYHYAYSPEDTLSDTRYVFVDNSGQTRHILHRDMPAILAQLNA